MVLNISVCYLKSDGSWIKAGIIDSLKDIHYKTDEIKIWLCFEELDAQTAYRMPSTLIPQVPLQVH